MIYFALPGVFSTFAKKSYLTNNHQAKTTAMKIHFNIDYVTQWGEELRIQLTKIAKDGQKKPVKECPLDTYDGRLWEGEVTFQSTDIRGIEYKYAMYRNGKLVWTEWEVAPHKVSFDGITSSYIISDQWRPIPEELPLYSSAYTECVGAQADDYHATDTFFSSTLQLRVLEPRLRKGEFLAI